MCNNFQQKKKYRPYNPTCQGIKTEEVDSANPITHIPFTKHVQKTSPYQPQCDLFTVVFFFLNTVYTTDTHLNINL